MNFQNQFLNALLSEEMITSTISIKKYLPESIPISTLGLETFFYIQAYGDTTANYPYHYEVENLDSYLILYTISGQSTLTYNNKHYTLLANTILFIDCKVKHSIKLTRSTSWHFQHIYINGNSVPTYYHLYNKDSTVLFRILDYSPIINFFAYIKSEHSSNSLEEELKNSMLITDLLTTIILEKNQRLKDKNTMPLYIRKMKNELETSYQDYYSLDLLATKYNRSKYRLSREFTQYVKISPINYLIRCRINAAKNLLWTTDITINEIGSLVGIDNTNHFINLFKKITGVTPGKYRLQRP